MTMSDGLETAIVVFAYKRPDHLGRVFQALALNPNWSSYPLRIYVDGPKSAADEDAVSRVISLSRDFVQDHHDAFIIARSENFGLYRSLTTGVSECLVDFESVIVLEDDIVLSPFALSYFSEALALYRNNSRVGSIHAYLPPVKGRLPETFFLRGADCWGWATWRDRWSLFRSDAAEMLQELERRRLVREFNLFGAYNYFHMLQGRALHQNNSWAICWHASCFLADLYTLYPGSSLAANIGFDDSGEHCRPDKRLEAQLSCRPLVLKRLDPLSLNSQSLFVYARHFARFSLKRKLFFYFSSFFAGDLWRAALSRAR
jgi:hypothetical protein